MARQRITAVSGVDSPQSGNWMALLAPLGLLAIGGIIFFGTLRIKPGSKVRRRRRRKR
jgi:hypothetical protein